VLYFLSRSRRQYCVVLLSNNPRYLRNLDESTRSSLQPEYIHFNSYSAPEILNILKDRATTGLKTVDDGMISEIAAMTAKNSAGDARIAIKSLLYCATQEAGSVQACFDKAREDVMADVLNNTNDKSLLILKAALLEPTRLVKSVYQHYIRLCREHREEPYGYTQYYAAISFMASLGVLALISAKIDRTYSNRIELLVTGEQIDAAIAKRFH
jgi:Cdc6-like AAA superfamily ATPase